MDGARAALDPQVGPLSVCACQIVGTTSRLIKDMHDIWLIALC